MKEGRPEDRNLADSAALAAKVEAKKNCKAESSGGCGESRTRNPSSTEKKRKRRKKAILMIC